MANQCNVRAFTPIRPVMQSIDAIRSPDPVRVLHIASGDLWAGAEAMVYALAVEQHRLAPGQIACVVMNDGPLARKLTEAGVPTRTLDESRQSFGSLLREVKSEIRRFNPDVVHAHREKENALAAAALLSRRGRRDRARLCTTVHGRPEPFTHRTGLRRRLARFANQLVCRLFFDRIVAVSDDLASWLRERYPDSKVIVVHNGVSVAPTPASAEPRSAGDELRLAAMGRMVPIKRFDRLGALSEELARRLEQRPTIVVAGDGPLADDLRRSLNADDPARRIEWRGFVKQSAALLQGVDGLLITSDHEGIPMVVLEAAALGVPVFGFATGGLPEIAREEPLVQLAPLGDIAALAATIAAYFKENARGSRRPRSRAWHFSVEQCAQRYARAYATMRGMATQMTVTGGIPARLSR